MSENEKKYQIGYGLPHCIRSDIDGFERLSNRLGLLNRRHRKDLLESDPAKERTRDVRKALTRRRLRPGERDHLLLIALYNDPDFRRDLWVSAYDRAQIGENENQTYTFPIPSLERRILANYIKAGYSSEDDASEIDKIFSDWPDLAQHLKKNVLWSDLAAHVCSDAWKNLDIWDSLSDELRGQTALLIFAVATIVDDERVLRAAVRKVPELEKEFGNVLNDGEDSEIATDSVEEEDILLRWNDLCESLRTLAAKAAGPPPVADALIKITHIVGDLEEIEQSVREHLAFTSFDHLMSHLDEFPRKLEMEQSFSWLDDEVRVQLHAQWQMVQQSLSPAQIREEFERLDTKVPIAVEEVRRLAAVLSDAIHQYDTLRTEKPTGFSSRIHWESESDEQMKQILALRNEQRQAKIALLSQLSPLGKTFELSRNDPDSLPVQVPAQDTVDELLVSVPAMRPLPDAYTPESEEPIVSTASAADEDLSTEQVAKTEISDVSSVSAEDAIAVDQELVLEEEHTDPNNGRESKQMEPIPPPSYPETERFESKGDTAEDSRLDLAAKRMIEALLASPPRIAYVVQVRRLIDRLDIATNQPPVELFEAALLSSHLRLPDASVATKMRQVFERFPLSSQFSDGLNRDLYVMLALAGTLHPALQAQQSGALVFLTALKPSERLGAVYQLARTVAEESKKLQGVWIDSSVLRGASDEVAWEVKHKQLIFDAAEWKAQALHKTIKYAPATKVWQQLLKSDGLIGQLITFIDSSGNENDALIHDIVIKLEERRVFEEQVKQIDREILNRRRGQDIYAGALNRLYAYAQEAVGLARRHLSLNSSKPSQSDFLLQALAALRDKVEQLSPPALSELDSCISKEESLFAGAANIASDAIRRFRDFLNPEHTGLDWEPDPVELTASGLFGYPSIHINDDGMPEGGSQSALDILISRNQPEALDSTFEQHLTAGDFRTAMRIADWVENEGLHDSDEFRNRFDESIQMETQRLYQEVGDVRTRVEIALAHEHISDAVRSDCDATLVEIERSLAESRVFRFDLERDKLGKIIEKIDHGLIEKKKKIKIALKELDLSSGSVEFKRILNSINQGDLVTANELIDRIRSKEPFSLEHLLTDQRHTFQDCYPTRLRAIEKALEDLHNNSGQIMEKIKESRPFAGMKLKNVPGAQRESARQMLEAWFMLKRIGRIDNSSRKNITALFSGLGFIVKKVTIIRSGQNLGEARIETDPVHDRERCPIPAFGSFVKGRYRIVFLWGRPTEEDILQHADERSGKQATIVLYLGRLSEARREAFSHMARQRSRTLLVLDELLLVFLCGERGSRMPILFTCALPFTYIQPYVTTAGLVPPEMFYGREQ